jgi:hypothetical protein
MAMELLKSGGAHRSAHTANVVNGFHFIAAWRSDAPYQLLKLLERALFGPCVSKSRPFHIIRSDKRTSEASNMNT